MRKVKKPVSQAGASDKSSRSGADQADPLARLKSDRQLHMRELDELRSELREQSEAEAEEADPGLLEKAKDLALVQQIEEHVAEIDHALAAAREGTYGICERCGRPIDPERLRILPETRLCVACKSETERRTPHGTRRP